MSTLMLPKLGFQAGQRESPADVDENLTSKMFTTGVEAARRRFTPEFMNRIDKIAVFRPLGQHKLRCILNLELGQVQQRILYTLAGKPFVFRTTDAAKAFLLAERYGHEIWRTSFETRN